MEIGNPGREGVGRLRSMINERKILQIRLLYTGTAVESSLFVFSSKLVRLDAVLDGRAAFHLLWSSSCLW